MSEKNVDALGWLHGLEDYLKFTKDEESRKFVRFILKLLYADTPSIQVSDSGSMKEFVYTLRKFATAPILDTFYKYYREGHDTVALEDAFSRGQVQSKIWLVSELAKIKKKFDNVFLLAGWYGQLLNYFDPVEIKYDKARVIDIDPVACEISDKIFNLNKIENFKVKSVELDLTDTSWLFRTGCNYTVKNYSSKTSFMEKTVPDLIINTSAEHFHEDWYWKFMHRPMPSNPLFVIQSNNLFDIPEHVNCVSSIEDMMNKFPMSEIYYSGEIQLAKYKRFMLIGRP